VIVSGCPPSPIMTRRAPRRKSAPDAPHHVVHTDQDVANRGLDDISVRRSLWIIVDGQRNERRRRDIFSRRGQKTTPKAPTPIVDLPARRSVSASDFGHDGVRRQTLGGDPSLLRLRASPTARGAGNHLNPSRVAFLRDAHLGVHFDVSGHTATLKSRGFFA
jgi:hypothetical protein